MEDNIPVHCIVEGDEREVYGKKIGFSRYS
jgi:hypothetical protein